MLTNRLLLLWLCIAISTCAFTQNITAAEYFFDKDPGPGKGSVLSVGTSADSVHFIPSIQTATLKAGFHSLFIRAKTANGKWGITEKRGLYIATSTGGSLTNITATEYFFDKDPGAGKAKPLAVGTPADSVHIIASIALTSLLPGFHSLYIRTKASGGKWGIAEKKGVYIATAMGGGLLNITAAEYFFDKDPGSGKAKPLAITNPSDSIHLLDSVSTANLYGKDHLLVVRVKTSAGKWGLYESRSFSLVTDRDRDGLIDWEEPKYGTDPLKFDTNGDGLADGVNVVTGLYQLSTDTDGDGLTNLMEILKGTSPIVWDSDGDGVSDSQDPFPLDRFRSKLPSTNLSDHTPPVINLQEPPL